MAKPTLGVITFPGSNCDDDAVHVAGSILGCKTVRLWHKDHDLQGSDLVILPGGFSYGDYLRTGAIARFAPILEEVRAFAGKGGPVLGICNGFQILCEAGLLPGVLIRNAGLKFVCKHIHIKRKSSSSPWTAGVPDGKALRIPVAHGEGNYFGPPDLIRRLQDEDRVAFAYCDEQGRESAESNPNGSLANIAGILNEKKNVLGMMPHPERASEAALGSEDGRAILEGGLAFVNGMIS